MVTDNIMQALSVYEKLGKYCYSHIGFGGAPPPSVTRGASDLPPLHFMNRLIPARGYQ